MTCAEYKTLREACGLSQQAAADFHDVALRTVQYWEAGGAVPPGVADEITQLNARIERAVTEAMALAAKHPADTVALVRYRTPQAFAGSRADGEGLSWPCHNALVGRMKLALERIGATVTIAWA